MLKSSRFKKALTTTVVLILVLSTVAVAAGDIYNKNIVATFGRIKFVVSGKDVTKTIEEKYGAPAFVVGDKSYVPVRAIADLMGLDIVYNTTTHTAEIIDSKSEKYEKELKAKDDELKKKDEEIAKLKKQLEPKKEPEKVVTDIEKLEKDLNKDYAKYKNVDFSIKLKETNTKIDVSVYVDFSSGRQEAYWSAMSYADRKTLIEDICYDVSGAFSDSNITGSIYDNYYRNNLVTFSKNKNANVVISYKGSASPSYGSGTGYGVDYVVEDEFYYKGIRDARASRVYYGSRETSLDITFSSTYSTEWGALSKATIESMLDRVAYEIDYYYYDDYYDNYNYYNNIVINVYMGSTRVGEYIRGYNSGYGTFTFK